MKQIDRRNFLKMIGVTIGGFALLPLSRMITSLNKKPIRTKKAKHWSSSKTLTG